MSLKNTSKSSDRLSSFGFDLAPAKREGGVIHPDELFWNCNCPKCSMAYLAQLDKWEEENQVCVELTNHFAEYMSASFGTRKECKKWKK